MQHGLEGDFFEEMESIWRSIDLDVFAKPVLAEGCNLCAYPFALKSNHQQKTLSLAHIAERFSVRGVRRSMCHQSATTTARKGREVPARPDTLWQ